MELSGHKTVRRSMCPRGKGLFEKFSINVHWVKVVYISGNFMARKMSGSYEVPRYRNINGTQFSTTNKMKLAKTTTFIRSIESNIDYVYEYIMRTSGVWHRVWHSSWAFQNSDVVLRVTTSIIWSYKGFVEEMSNDNEHAGQIRSDHADQIAWDKFRADSEDLYTQKVFASLTEAIP